ncbi:NAD(P)-dependent oxidoreductase [Oryzicola mucosus]|uniref:D-2-hydroxyacid dehydrogenase n=1 Tax=Oryzicola mucosus TaxID=2767425 RepID=A0A8J6PPA8_9HYPH|nr:NAD(P)-dependent oxidoreductase [Oryzicola mucosus]MBD0417351.1 hypothetical protein [Oryzicola mucosus]
MKIVVWSLLAEGAIVARRLSERHDVVVVKDKIDLPAALQGAAGFVLENSRYDAQIAAVLVGGSVGWIQLLSAGYENLVTHGVAPGIVVTNAGDARSPNVAEHAVALLLGLVRGLPVILSAQRQETWQPHIARGLSTLEDGAALIVGYGGIGREIATRLLAFGMRVSAVNRSPVDDPRLSQIHGLADLDNAVAAADVVAIAIAYVPATHHLFSARRLAAMKRGALLVNVARGGVVDTEALAAGLQQGDIGGAALDVTDPEPLPDGHPFWRVPNLIISPHLGGTNTQSATERLCALVLANADGFSRGERPLGPLRV